ncbi:hypothetical protein HYC85_001023 [Camellia sinensis]|uniref:Protein kinase domain-containing protein n=1 Tax=Camellia sinensis TaxID=4442 RepID=A0A7J7I5Y6_CAMSI|nr:hypothetical protein HYC85_001023 [Camellia sinensis]
MKDWTAALNVRPSYRKARLRRVNCYAKELNALRTTRTMMVMARKTKIYIVLEYVGEGELFDKIAKLGRLKEDEARRYSQQLINAVDYCHSRGMYHRDLKPENLLLDSFGVLKVSDFGLSAFSQQVRVLTDKGYDGTAADIWSCGVILFVLMAGYLPFDEPNHMALKAIKNLLLITLKRCDLNVFNHT